MLYRITLAVRANATNDPVSEWGGTHMNNIRYKVAVGCILKVLH